MNSHLVCKQEGDQQIVYGEVYAPNRPDADQEFMTAEEIQKMAHEFTAKGDMGSIDMMHNNRIVKGCRVVESFVARKGDPDFLEGAWVVGVHIPDPEIWDLVKKGELNGFSMEAFVGREVKEVEIEIPPVVSGLTSKSEGHVHKFYVHYDNDGLFRGGVTDVVNGHSHKIIAGTHTEESLGHTHRFSSVDTIRIL